MTIKEIFGKRILVLKSANETVDVPGDKYSDIITKVDVEEVRESGIAIVNLDSLTPLKGTVFLVGTECNKDYIKSEDKILYDKLDYIQIKSGGVEYQMILEENVIAVI